MTHSNRLNFPTFHHSEFSSLIELIDLKKQQGISISLCIPTLNEEKTIGSIIEAIRFNLIEKHPLLDEIVVVDSGSSDQTKVYTLAAGAQFYLASEIRPDLGNYPGKGENLWKALHVLKGDIICYIDGDIKNIHPRFVYGLVAPLLKDSSLQYTKAYYKRPLREDPSTIGSTPLAGGRVTEILIRPLLNLFYPELAGFIQPLSGEYAARRSLLESIPFPSGYGVESTHLIDIYEKHGLSVFAQVDLEQRIHHNQSIHALGKMAFHILQCITKRLQNKKTINRELTIPELFSQFIDTDQATTSRLSPHERPPINTII